MGSNYPQYSHNDGTPHVQNIYHHNNSQNMVWGNDREMMTCDGGGGVYFGHATSASILQLPRACTSMCRRALEGTVSAPPHHKYDKANRSILCILTFARR